MAENGVSAGAESRERSRSRSRPREARAGAGTRAEADSGAEQGQPAAQDLVRVQPCPTAGAVAAAAEQMLGGSITVRQHGGVLEMLAQFLLISYFRTSELSAWLSFAMGDT